jgi:tRNA A-37 threonylcarbamoyl transferase component Bud32
VVGTTIGKYLVTAQLGRGSTGVLYKGVDHTLNRDVAMKVLRLDAADEEMLHRFRAETAVLARLNHPDIVTIYEFLETDTDFVMVMEFVAGESLEGFARRSGPLAPDVVAYLIDRALAALEYAHRFGIVHRDLKPANVMVTNVGGIKLMDFGIARVCASHTITRQGSMMGTPGYMAPEQILGQPADIRADVYAVGAILYRLLAGEAPFQGGTTADLIQRQLSEEPPPLRQRRLDVPESYQRIVMRAMAKAPDDRFRTTDELREALGRASGTLKAINLSKRLARECPGDAALTNALTPLAAIDPTAAPDTVWLRGGGRERRRGTTAVAALAAAAILALLARVKFQDAPHPATDAASSAPAPALQVEDRGVRGAESPNKSTATAAVSAAPKPSRKPSEVAASAPRESGASGSPPNATHVEGHAAANAAALATASPPAAPPTPASVDERPADATVTRRPDSNFKAKFLAIADTKARELDVRLTLGDRALTLMASDDSGKQLQTLDYSRMTAVSYSVSRDPLWQSPDGPAPVLRRGGMLRKFGFSNARHWIVLSTESDAFVVLQVNEETAPSVLSLLEDHTGLRSHRLTDTGAPRPKE